MGGNYGDKTGLGGSRSSYRHPVETAEFDRALREAEESRKREGKGEPMNIRRRPVRLPPMVNIKDGGRGPG